jgi:hypothetical protein
VSVPCRCGRASGTEDTPYGYAYMSSLGGILQDRHPKSLPSVQAVREDVGRVRGQADLQQRMIVPQELQPNKVSAGPATAPGANFSSPSRPAVCDSDRSAAFNSLTQLVGEVFHQQQVQLRQQKLQEGLCDARRAMGFANTGSAGSQGAITRTCLASLPVSWVWRAVLYHRQVCKRGVRTAAPLRSFLASAAGLMPAVMRRALRISVSGWDRAAKRRRSRFV